MPRFRPSLCVIDIETGADIFTYAVKKERPRVMSQLTQHNSTSPENPELSEFLQSVCSYASCDAIEKLIHWCVPCVTQRQTLLALLAAERRDHAKQVYILRDIIRQLSHVVPEPERQRVLIDVPTTVAWLKKQIAAAAAVETSTDTTTDSPPAAPPGEPDAPRAEP